MVDNGGIWWEITNKKTKIIIMSLPKRKKSCKMWSIPAIKFRNAFASPALPYIYINYALTDKLSD